MSKYEPLWEWIKANGKDSFKLTFLEIEKIAGLPTDHSFLTYKKELTDYGFKVSRISMKERTVEFERLNQRHPSSGLRSGFYAINFIVPNRRKMTK